MTRPTPSPRAANTRRAQLTLFLTIFVAMLGLSILFPIIAPLSRELGLTETQTGLFSVAYSLMQFLCSPLWGARSERAGRKPVLLTGLLGFTASFALFAFIADLGLRGALRGTGLFALLIGARLLGGGLSSATLPTAQAMMADLSDKQHRAAAMGLIGAAFGLGVVFGPGLGALLSRYGLTVPVYASAALGLLTALFAATTLRETRTPGQPDARPTRGLELLRRGPVRLALAISALYTLASVGMEQTIGFYVQDTLNLTPARTAVTVGGMLAIFGFLAAFVQGGAIRPLSKRLPPRPLILTGLLIMGAGMLLIPAAHTYWTITGALALVGVGSAILGPTLSAALSLNVTEDEQGRIAGLNSSALALGRLGGPLVATSLYQYVSSSGPYLLSGAVLLLLLLVAAALWRPTPPPATT
ncbi:MFS transporter [Deinococcus maricopensis]|uniref:Major facilitator superfamily MFS_1 n=1 Tax=Deinococcus maricopensis (strain DSM 21211 / LMG 22137 / NRRL B-23946 / LB-34) TaxID=709986 RepID=E8U7L7_DEIML|nr:MFS transporter [Deinococcus maricopensis]ADV67056.1 major facilitator superfamily MFS_1 [Deinococcus maricopensis DSM 21211]